MLADPHFEHIVNLYYRDLYRFAFSLTRNQSDAADLTQQTFYIWANKGDQLRSQANVKGWLFTTLHREFLQTRRRQERFPDEPLSDTMKELPLPAHTINSVDVGTMLECLGKIDESYRACLVLYYVEDFSYKQIAEVLKVPIGTVQSRISRGKLHLYHLLTNVTRSAKEEKK